MLQRLGRYIINCPYLGVWRCEAPRDSWDGIPLNLDWKPEDCEDCLQCISFQKLPEARFIKVIKQIND